MVSAPEGDELSNFLEFGLDFSAFDESIHDGHCLGNDGVMAMNTSIEHSGAMSGMKEMQQGQIFPRGMQSYSAPMGGFDTAGVPRMDPGIQKQIIRQYLQFQQQQNMRGLDFQQVPIVPPTPNSMELHEEAARYCQHMDANGRVWYERQPRSKEDQVRHRRALYT